MVKDRLARPDVAGGFILDGYPRTVRPGRAYLDEVLLATGRQVDRVLSYEVPQELLVDRMSGRRSCPNVRHRLPRHRQPAASRPASATATAAALVQRDDDKPENGGPAPPGVRGQDQPLKRYYRERAPVGGRRRRHARRDAGRTRRVLGWPPSWPGPGGRASAAAEVARRPRAHARCGSHRPRRARRGVAGAARRGRVHGRARPAGRGQRPSSAGRARPSRATAATRRASASP